MVAMKLPTVSSEGGLSRYLAKVRRFPMLSHEEEYMLARRWREEDDIDAAHKLVTSHLRLVAKMAIGYAGHGLPVGELISEGNVGMMQAVERFEPERGFRLATYAMWWIRAAIQEYTLHSWSLVKIGTTAAQKRLFFNLRKLKGQLQAIDDGDLPHSTVTEIARRLAVPEAEVISMNRRMAGPDHSLNAPPGVDGDGEWIDWLADDEDNQEQRYAEVEELAHRRALLDDAIGDLNERERTIFTERRLNEDPKTLEELGQIYGVSRQRVRQIEVRTFEKVREAVRQSLAEQAAARARVLKAA